MLDQIARRKRKEERQEKAHAGRFSVFFASAAAAGKAHESLTLLKKVFCMLCLSVIIGGIVWGSAVVFGFILNMEETLPVSKDGYYEIDSAEDFYLFWEEICADDEYARGRIMKDICLNKISDDMGWEEWEDLRLYRGVVVFSGVFDGNGHTIYGIYSNRGYSLAMKNEGKICNLSIRDSIIYGNYNPQFIWGACGGICKENSGVISECEFGGKLYTSAASGGKLSGICSRNLGTIEQCGFSGTIDADGEYFDGKVSGICMENQGEIIRCYNLTDLHEASWIPWQPKRFNAITDQGEKQCFAMKDSGWFFPEGGQTAAIGWQHTAYIPALIRADIYGLFVKCRGLEENQELQEMLEDEIVSDLIMEVIVAKGENWDSLSLETEIWGESVLLILSDGEEDVTINISPAWKKRAGRNEDNFEGLWQECAESLREKEAESFEHSSWQMMTGQEGEEKPFGEFVFFRTNMGRQGFFLRKDGKLYRIESRKNQKKMSEMQAVMLQELWKDRTPSVGAYWSREEIREAALAELSRARKKKVDMEKDSWWSTDPEAEQEIWETEPTREELYALETLHISDFDWIRNLDDLAKMPHLKSLSFYGNELAHADFDLEKGMVQELEKLEISHVNLSDLDFLEQFPQLKELSVWDCGLEDISGIGYQEELVNVSLGRNAVRNIWPLRNCKKLETLSLYDNQVEDLSALASLSQIKEIYISCNEIQEIDALRYLTKLQYLSLGDNRIEDFEPITGLADLCYLNIRNNPGQNIGDLVFLPRIDFGNGEFSENGQEAQAILESFYPHRDLIAKDMVKGDLNGDGITDIAIASLCVESEDSGTDDSGRIYLFLGKADGTFRSLTSIDMFDPGNGVFFGGSYDGMLLMEGRLAVQAEFGGTGGGSQYTLIYEYEKGEIREKWRLELVDDVRYSGYEFTITDQENQHEKYYVIVDDRQLLLKDDNGEVSAVEKEFLEEYTEFQKYIGESLPEIPEFVYQPQTIDQIHDDVCAADRLPEEVLSEAAGIFLYDYSELPVPCYTSEEILYNYESLAGVELPKVFFIGYSTRDDEIIILTYRNYWQNADGNFEHAISMWHIVDGDWCWKENISYDEEDSVFAVG